MSTDLAALFPLKKRDIKKAANVFARAFQTDLLEEFMFPDDDFRKKILPLYFNYRIKFGILFGEVYATTSNIEGLAVWYKRNDFIMSNWKNFRAGGMKLLFHVDNEALKRMFTIGHFSNQLRDEYTTSDYWYLAPIGIDPIHQGKGFASKLIRPMLVRFDSEQLPCLLETQSANNVSLYKRYGFEIVKETTLPGTTIAHWLMVRQPKK
ncbi:MAG TPA: GNAT family N-acetyltransferase [Candidatus Bathyarchaeia archaeon]|nr:GNAT family N-acetyltransferase [Candidatus Bathyarchaeia archaeon]